MRSDNWFGHAMRRTRWQPQRQVIALGSLGFFIALIFGALYLSQVATQVTDNRRVSELLAVRDELERTNQQLRLDIAELKAVTRLQAQAEALGFLIARPEQIEYLPVPGYVPRRPDTVAPIIPAAESSPEIYDETFAGWLEEQWDNLRRSISGG